MAPCCPQQELPLRSTPELSLSEPLPATLVDLGDTPLANSYLAREQLTAPEPTFPLHARICSACRLVQVDDVAAPDDIFGHYAYFSSYSASWVEHARLSAWFVLRFRRLSPHRSKKRRFERTGRVDFSQAVERVHAAAEAARKAAE